MSDKELEKIISDLNSRVGALEALVQARHYVAESQRNEAFAEVERLTAEVSRLNGVLEVVQHKCAQRRWVLVHPRPHGAGEHGGARRWVRR